MPVYLVRAQRTIRYSGLVLADSAVEAAVKFGDQVRARPDENFTEDTITEVQVTEESEDSA